MKSLKHRQFQANVFLVSFPRTRRRNPDVSFDIDHGFGLEPFSVRVINDALAGVFECDSAALLQHCDRTEINFSRLRISCSGML